MIAKHARIQPAPLHRPDGLTDKEFKLFRELIYQHTGISLSEHKRALIYSRLGKRLRKLGLTRYLDYYNYILDADNDGSELVEMINAITTNKTSFFREEYHFNYLKEVLFPGIIQQENREYSKNLNIWSAGCSTGEEAYTIAMVLAEAFPEDSGWNLYLTASDIDTNVLEKAVEGIYPFENAEQIPKKLLLKYFHKGSGDNSGFIRASDKLRRMINFQKINLLGDGWPHKRKFDIIFCRNVIIYFDKPTQQKLISRFQQYLVPNGTLMLGHSESLHGHDTSLVNIGKNIYKNAIK